MTLAETLATLEQLKSLIDRYNPIKFESTDEKRALAQEIPQTYGVVQDIYRLYAGDHQVEVQDRGHKNSFPNYFEAGYLSGRTFHAHAGYQELLRVIGRVRAEADRQKPGGTPSLGLEAVWPLVHPKVRGVAEERFNNGHFADAVEAALKALDNEVRAIAMARGGEELSGARLMYSVFSLKNTLIVLGNLSTQSGRDTQQGFMEMFAGAMLAIRNPKAHDNIAIDPTRAIHLLFVASTLWYTLDARV